MKSAITPATEQVFELFISALSDSDIEPLSNAAFAIGLLIEHSEMDLSSQYLPVLSLLRPLFEVTPQSSAGHFNAKDNAAGAVARMIVKNPGALPLDQVLPIFVNALPLKNDYLENRPVFRAIFSLLDSNPQVLMPYIDHLLQVFATVLDPNAPDQVGDQIRGELIRRIGTLNAQDPAKIQQYGLSAYV
jgi:importin-4